MWVLLRGIIGGAVSLVVVALAHSATFFESMCGLEGGGGLGGPVFRKSSCTLLQEVFLWPTVFWHLSLALLVLGVVLSFYIEKRHVRVAQPTETR